jgi:hypothetical protein
MSSTESESNGLNRLLMMAVGPAKGIAQVEVGLRMPCKCIEN